jgi:poly-gamma-glutamate synthesis protein (capsule biosynthesis protein)
MKMDRRGFLKRLGGVFIGGPPAKVLAQPLLSKVSATVKQESDSPSVDSRSVTLFLCGDVMTGRGIDQVLPHPNRPDIYEPYIRNALGYVELAERANGPIRKPVDFAYIWGDALAELDRVAPDVRLINLETAVTKSDEYWKGKGIHYRMHPANVPCITAAGIDCCVLANNHVLDWGYAGLRETLETLQKAGVQTAGAGSDQAQAESAALFPIAGKGRVIVIAFGHESSGVPRRWGARRDRPGVNLLDDLSDRSIRYVAELSEKLKGRNDILVASIHWGGNWGYHIPPDQVRFAHRLIDEAGIDMVHGHSSHHFKGIEVYRDKPILYGCGDFLNDYEGIGGYEQYRGDLALMYFANMDSSSGNLRGLEITPTQTRHLRVNRASSEDAEWIREVLNRESQGFGVRFDLGRDNRLILRW